MADTRDPIGAGHYAREQIHSRDPFIAWSHRRRFRTALALARPFANTRLLDYGCGDGTFLALLQASGRAPACAVGAEIDPWIVADCRRRFADCRAVRFVEVADLASAGEAGSYDAIFCMEVLEHVPDAPTLLAEFERLLRPGGTLVTSVPVETGLPILVKQMVRCVAGWRRIGNYPGTSSYTPRELLTSVFASSRQHMIRPVFRRDDGVFFHDHKGFNWRVLRSHVAARFDLLALSTSPIHWLGPQLSTQVWLIARKRLRPERGAQSPRESERGWAPASAEKRLRHERGVQSPRESERGWGPASPEKSLRPERGAGSAR